MSADSTPAGDGTGEQAILQRRAAQLARAPAPATGGGGAEVLEIAVAGQRCLLGLEWVREVRPLRPPVAVPLGPAALLGLAHVRGQMLPVLDLAVLLGIQERSSPSARLVVLGRGIPSFAVPADVFGVAALEPANAERRAGALHGLTPELVRGVTADGRLLLDGARLLAMNTGLPSSLVPTAVHHEES